MARSAEAGVAVRCRHGVAGFAGLQRCGSVWSCPVCSAQVLTHRALEIGSALGQAMASGHVLGFGTLTMRHNRDQSLADLWAAAGQGWQRAISGKRWMAHQREHGVVGWVRVWEVTYGRNGWHVHVHFVVVLQPGATADNLDAVAGGMYERWARGLVAAGLDAPRLVGQEWHLAAGAEAAGQLAEYLFKLVEGGDASHSLGLELTHTMPGRSRGGLRTQPVWWLLRELVETGEAWAAHRWAEWERASKGRRQVGWSTGLRQRFAPSLEDLSDDEVVERELGSSDDDLVLITAEGYRRLVLAPANLPKLLDAAEAGGRPAVAEMLDQLKVPYEMAGCVPAGRPVPARL